MKKLSFSSTLLNELFTEPRITEVRSREASNEQQVKQIEPESSKDTGLVRTPSRTESTIKLEAIFKPLPGQGRIRTVMMTGDAGVGKTALTQKYASDWAEDKVSEEKAKQNEHFLFPFTFRELNLMKEKNFSLVQLLHHFFGETKAAGICTLKGARVAFTFDALDECRLPLDFQNNAIWTDVTEPTSVDVLFTNLIQGNLLPNACIWITSRPGAANQIPSKYVDRVTEVKGFSESQMEQYFMKSCTDEKIARTIIAHIKTSRSLQTMCQFPLFCCITAAVLENMLRTAEKGVMPKNQTEMFIHFMVVQSEQKNVKYHDRAQTHSDRNPGNSQAILSLGRLAFEQLEKGNRIFSEADLTECGIDIRDASVYSGVLTQIFKEDRGLEDKVFFFVHLSIQEFLAALYVYLHFVNTGAKCCKRGRENYTRLGLKYNHRVWVPINNK